MEEMSFRTQLTLVLPIHKASSWEAGITTNDVSLLVDFAPSRVSAQYRVSAGDEHAGIMKVRTAKAKVGLTDEIAKNGWSNSIQEMEVRIG